MTPTYQFLIRGLGPCQDGYPAVILDAIGAAGSLALHLDQPDLEEFAAEWSGLLTSRSRMAFVLALLLDSLEVGLPAVHLRRNRAAALEAHLILERGAETVFFGVNLGDAIALARLRKLAIFGDQSLTPWLEAPATSHGCDTSSHADFV